MKLKRFLALTLVSLFLLSVTIGVFAAPIPPCGVTGGPHETYVNGNGIIICYLCGDVLGYLDDPTCPPHNWEYMGGYRVCTVCGVSNK